MKRSILFGLAGFGLASMLFALVAFVGEGKNENNEGYVYVKVLDTNATGGGYIVVAYPDGKIDKTGLPRRSTLVSQGKDENSLIVPVLTTINKLKLEGYKLESHNAFDLENFAYQ